MSWLDDLIPARVLEVMGHGGGEWGQPNDGGPLFVRCECGWSKTFAADELRNPYQALRELLRIHLATAEPIEKAGRS